MAPWENRPRQRERVASHIPKPALTGTDRVFHYLVFHYLVVLILVLTMASACASQLSPRMRLWTPAFHSRPSHLRPPPTETHLFATLGKRVGVTTSGARILLAAESPALCLLYTQRRPKLAHVFQRLPPPSLPQGPTGNSAKIIISNWGFVRSSGKTSSPFRIIRLRS